MCGSAFWKIGERGKQRKRKPECGSLVLRALYAHLPALSADVLLTNVEAHAQAHLPAALDYTVPAAEVAAGYVEQF
jgi:hypothetical protein